MTSLLIRYESKKRIIFGDVNLDRSTREELYEIVRELIYIHDEILLSMEERE